MDTLEDIIKKERLYEALPEAWHLPSLPYFAGARIVDKKKHQLKKLYDYQIQALRNAACALFLYYDGGGGKDTEPSLLKQAFARYYPPSALSDVAVVKSKIEGDPFSILSPFFAPHDEESIDYTQLINRMCFWMATGSGKTLIIVKLIEYLFSLRRHGLIPPHPILILAHKDYLLAQIRATIHEFNITGVDNPIDLVHLRAFGEANLLGNNVYYHLSDNIADEQTNARTDYRAYAHDGKWFVILDEAHRGAKDDSKRQAYYHVMARQGFLFNFSASFTERADILTSVKKYNLEDFTKKGHGKHVYLNEQEYRAFSNAKDEINTNERKAIVLKSLITLTAITQQVEGARRTTGLADLYHVPLMMTLVHSVNTDREGNKNDLWVFFQTLREIIAGETDERLFHRARESLKRDWRGGTFLFSCHDTPLSHIREASSILDRVTMEEVRRSVFLSPDKGTLQYIVGESSKEIAFQVKNSEKPFALIRIGDTGKWKQALPLLYGYEKTQRVNEQAFFEQLNHKDSSITLLMGSRSFVESWDSNRPNVINYINIGGVDAKKFVVQSVGRGVRIEPVSGYRLRYAFLNRQERETIGAGEASPAPLAETVFLFATNRRAMGMVLKGLASTKEGSVERLQGIIRAPVPTIPPDNIPMPLLIPTYKKEKRGEKRRDRQFTLADETFERFKAYLAQTSDSVLIVRDGLSLGQVGALRQFIESCDYRRDANKTYDRLSFLQKRVIEYLKGKAEIVEGMRPLVENGDDKDDIVHFRHICVRYEYRNGTLYPDKAQLESTIANVKQGKEQDRKKLARLYAEDKITEREFDKRVEGRQEGVYGDLTIKNIMGHYYVPVILGNEKVDYIQHIIKAESERRFIGCLEAYVGKDEERGWDAWMFSRIDGGPNLDKVSIPYHDGRHNMGRKFYPDFIFWLCKGDNYKIVFVDPKGTTHADSYVKIDGYRVLFERDGKVRTFHHDGKNVQLFLYMFTDDLANVRGERYKDYWIDDPEPIFRAMSGLS